MLTFEEAWEALARCHGERVTVLISGPFGPVAGFCGKLLDGDCWDGGDSLLFRVEGEAGLVCRRAAFVETEWRQDGSRLMIRERGGLVVEVDPVPAPVRRRHLEVVS